jgi:hypothetical protein
VNAGSTDDEIRQYFVGQRIALSSREDDPPTSRCFAVEIYRAPSRHEQSRALEIIRRVWAQAGYLTVEDARWLSGFGAGTPFARSLNALGVAAGHPLRGLTFIAFIEAWAKWEAGHADLIAGLPK